MGSTVSLSDLSTFDSRQDANLFTIKSVLRALRVQFKKMIMTPKTTVEPTKELASLILGGPSNAETHHPSPAANVWQSSVLGEIDGAPVLGPLPPPIETSKVTPEHPLNEPTVTVTDQDVEMTENSSDHNWVTETDTAQQSGGQSENVTSSQPQQATRAPPVPPRPSPAAGIQARFDIHRQQDVTEVLHDVLIRIMCALKAPHVYYLYRGNRLWLDYGDEITE